jgi:hypothetical protein
MKNNNMQDRNFTEYRVEYLTEDTYWVAKEFKTQQDAFSFMEKVKIEHPKHNWQVTKLSYVYEKVSESN